MENSWQIMWLIEWNYCQSPQLFEPFLNYASEN